MLGGNVYQLENDEPLLDHIKFRLVGFDHVVMAMNPVAGSTHVILAGFKNGELRTSEFIAEDMERAFETAITTLKEARPEPGGIRLMGRNIQDLRSDPTAIGNVRSAQGVGEWDNLVVNIANIGNSIMEYRAVVISLKDGNLKVHQVENVSLAHAVTGALEGLWFSKPVRIVKK